MVDAYQETLIHAWLVSAEPDLPTFANILQGEFRPIQAASDHASDWIIDALDTTPGSSRSRVCEHIRLLLEKRPDRYLSDPASCPYPRVRQLVHNLFNLCSQLQRPLEFAPVLQAMLHDGTVRGKWSGFDLNRALQRAVIRNQDGPALRGDLMACLQQRPSPFTLNIEDAVAAFSWMPRSPLHLHEPWYDAIGEALAAAIARLEQDYPEDPRLRRDIFSLILTTLKAPWVHANAWERELPLLAAHHEWPGWACMLLKPLTVLNQDSDVSELIASRFLLACVPADLASSVSSISQSTGTFLHVRTTLPVHLYLAHFVDKFEELIRENPFDGVGAIVASVLYVLDHANTRASAHEDPLAHFIVMQKRAILVQFYKGILDAIPENASRLETSRQAYPSSPKHLDWAADALTSPVVD